MLHFINLLIYLLIHTCPLVSIIYFFLPNPSIQTSSLPEPLRSKILSLKRLLKWIAKTVLKNTDLGKSSGHFPTCQTEKGQEGGLYHLLRSHEQYFKLTARQLAVDM